ncbi:hypothetical protein HYFRA_00000560 [Hymenoscyphus fraxineus]|uniref:Uncharacterized protein n=1 Tax=Hymenoscyphus fraxineus TaxID=746836 RepID=A0A9N9PY09_9HELO|nr:hypothetical protein HYFRA_00000560 [Hymenoscyphus fraxineus]
MHLPTLALTTLLSITYAQTPSPFTPPSNASQADPTPNQPTSYNVAGVLATSPLTEAQQSSRNTTNWVHVRVEVPEGTVDPHGGVYRGVPLGQLTYLAGDATQNSAVNVQTINYAGGSGSVPLGAAIECRAFKDSIGQVPFGLPFGDAPNGGQFPYPISGSNVTGVELRTVLCINRGIAIVNSTVL